MRQRSVCVVVLACASGLACAQSRFAEVAGASGCGGSFEPAAGYPAGLRDMAGGACVGDFNGDGRPDIFAPGGGSVPDRLYINIGAGVFEDRAPAWGVDALHRGSASASADFNADGYLDLFVLGYGDVPDPARGDQARLYRNNGPDASGQYSFTEIASVAGLNRVADGIDGMGAGFGDYDLDGDLDVYVASWRLNSNGNRLFRNEGAGEDGVTRFVDVTSLLGLDTSELRGFTPRFADVNEDRWPDLLLTNDFGNSRLLINNGPGTSETAPFMDWTDGGGIRFDCNGMGASVADIDGNGLLDWYITNIYFAPDGTCGNNLYLNTGLNTDGLPLFDEASRDAGVVHGGWGWGTSVADFDNDGDIDIAATNGWGPSLIPSRLFFNDGAGGFTDRATETGFTFVGQGRGLYHIDHDLDGDLDIVIIENGGRLRLFRNDLEGPARNFLRVRLTTHRHPCIAPGGYGTRLALEVGVTTRREYSDSEATYMGQSERVLHFGLGAAESADRLTIEWADGRVTVLEDIAANQTIDVEALHPGDFDASARLDVFDLLTMLGLFAEQDPGADLDESGVVDLFDALLMIEWLDAPCG